MTTWMSKGSWALTAFLSVGVALFSFRYLGPTNVTMSTEVLANLFARPFLWLHVAGAATALTIGMFQFLPAVRRRRTLHRWLGRIYATGCIAGGAAGLVLATGTTAGPIAAWGFGLLAVTWIYSTGQAWLMARARRFDEHRRWMIRSFALTFAAVTLRLYLPFPPMLGFSFVEGYRAIAWLAWVPNLLLAEAYLRREMLALQPAE